jgi:hypothetical protein
MNRFRSILYIRLTVYTIALIIFNLSIDPPDNCPKEDLSVNEIESIVELVLENVCNIDNAVKEHEDHDTPGGNRFTFKTDLLTSCLPKIHPRPEFITIAKQFTPFDLRHFKSRSGDIASPPPKI